MTIGADPRRSGKPPEPRPGLHLVVEIVDGKLTVRRTAFIASAWRHDLRAPILTPETIQRLRAPASEIVLALLSADGTLLDQFGWPAEDRAFFDRGIPGDRGGLQGSPRRTREPLRILRVPVPRETAFLQFSRADVVIRPDRTPVLEQHHLAMHFLGPEPFPPLPPLPLPIPVDIPPLPLPWAARWERPPKMRPPGYDADVRILGGYIDSWKTIVDNGDPAHRFDVVIMSEGFTKAELPIFDEYAAVFAAGLLAMAPFNFVADLMNVHVVRAVSWEAGVDNCPNPSVPRDTYFNVEGNFRNAGYAGFYGTPTPEKVWAAAEHIAPLETIELIVVIVNLAFDGGSAFPDQGIAFTSLWDTPEKFVNIGAHESCHVVAKTAEEYIGCVPPEADESYPNQATAGDVTSDNVWWKGLAAPGELDGELNFRAVHTLGDPFDSTGQPVMPATLDGMLGLFWGCQTIDDSLPGGGCDPWQDFRGAGYYRAMARCRMRKSYFPFCRVCADRLRSAIVYASL